MGTFLMLKPKRHFCKSQKATSNMNHFIKYLCLASLIVAVTSLPVTLEKDELVLHLNDILKLNEVDVSRDDLVHVAEAAEKLGGYLDDNLDIMLPAQTENVEKRFLDVHVHVGDNNNSNNNNGHGRDNGNDNGNSNGNDNGGSGGSCSSGRRRGC